MQMEPEHEIQIEPLCDHSHWIPDLARWHHLQWAAYNPGETLAGRVARLEGHTGDDGLPRTWVAFRERVLLGSASLVESDLENRPDLRPWLASVFVAPEARRCGIGSRLVQHVASEARLLGFLELFLFTADQEAFYGRLGWEIVEHLLYRQHPVTLMRVALGAQP